MVQFNELYINQEGTKLYIDVEVKDLCYYDNVYIEKIIIDNQDTYTSYGPSNSPKYVKMVSDYSGITDTTDLCDEFCGIIPTEKELSGGRKRIRLELTNKEVPLTDLLFVHVSVAGVPDPSTPCGMDNMNTLGIVYNVYPKYKTGLQYIKKQLCKFSSCSSSNNSGLIDFILHNKMFDLALDLGNYNEAIKLWKKKPSIESTIKSKCNCNG